MEKEKKGTREPVKLKLSLDIAHGST
jgi:hypothetical protein